MRRRARQVPWYPQACQDQPPLARQLLMHLVQPLQLLQLRHAGRGRVQAERRQLSLHRRIRAAVAARQPRRCLRAAQLILPAHPATAQQGMGCDTI